MQCCRLFVIFLTLGMIHINTGVSYTGAAAANRRQPAHAELIIHPHPRSRRDEKKLRRGPFDSSRS